jgi:predicted nucleotidyltransferase
MTKEAVLINRLKKELPELLGVYVFGSRISGHSRPESDLDVAFLLASPKPYTDTFHLFQLVADLGSEMGCPVDLVDLNRAPTDLRFEIITTARRIYCADKTQCDTFEMLTYSLYQKLEEERSGIIQAVKERGSIYG